MPSPKPPEPPSWYLLPSGELTPLTTTQALLLDLAPVVEDTMAAYQDLKVALARARYTTTQARELIVRSRRQRLELRLIKGLASS